MASGIIDRALPSRTFMYDVTVDYAIIVNDTISENIKNLINTYVTKEECTVIINGQDGNARDFTIITTARNANYNKSIVLSYYLGDQLHTVIKVGTSWKLITFSGTAETL